MSINVLVVRLFNSLSYSDMFVCGPREGEVGFWISIAEKVWPSADYFPTQGFIHPIWQLEATLMSGCQGNRCGISLVVLATANPEK